MIVYQEQVCLPSSKSWNIYIYEKANKSFSFLGKWWENCLSTMQSECKYLTAYLASFWYGKQENKPCRRFFIEKKKITYLHLSFLSHVVLKLNCIILKLLEWWQYLVLSPQMFFRLFKKQKTKKVLFLLVFLKPFFFFLILDFPLWKKVKNNTPKTQTSDTAFFWRGS